jgi:hypothetical protein
LKLTIFSLQQNYNKCPKTVRNNTYNVITYNVSKPEFETIFEEKTKIPKKDFENLISQAYKDKHDWLCFNREGKIFKGFDEVPSGERSSPQILLLCCLGKEGARFNQVDSALFQIQI